VIALENYKLACDHGRGAVFFATARSTIANVNFTGHYGRCVVIYGVPYHNTLSRNLRVRMQYIEEKFGITQKEQLAIDALQQV
jgi:DNA excision repair protein ERCC-2